jgi:hypothetical protein
VLTIADAIVRYQLSKRQPELIQMTVRPHHEVAATILAQLGGQKFIAMTGAKDFLNNGDGLTFRIPRSNDITHVTITLDVNDLYRVTFNRWNARRLEMTIVHTVGDVYADMLPALFTEQTGLHTSL